MRRATNGWLVHSKSGAAVRTSRLCPNHWEDRKAKGTRLLAAVVGGTDTRQRARVS